MTKAELLKIRNDTLKVVDFIEETHLYIDKADKFHYQSVSSQIKEFSEAVYSGFDVSDAEKEIIMRKAAKIGNYIHKVFEKYLKNETFELPSVNKKTENVGSVALNNFKRWLENNQIEPLVSELILVDRVHKLAGTIDLIFNRNNKTYLCDFKTSNVSADSIVKKKALYALQLKYYQKLSELNGIKIDGLAVLFINKRSGLINIVIIKKDLSNDAQEIVEAKLENKDNQKDLNSDYINKYIN